MDVHPQEKSLQQLGGGIIATSAHVKSLSEKETFRKGGRSDGPFERGKGLSKGSRNNQEASWALYYLN